MRKIFLIVAILILVIITFFSGIFLNKKFLIFPVSFLENYFSADLYKENSTLKLENESLKAQVESAVNFSDSKNASIAQIFSTYPFNVKDQLIVDKGAKQGIKKGMNALAAPGILLGQVADVSDNSATIKTVFDSNWQIPVKIGEAKINGLFKGGNDPKITLIEKPVKEGDPVFAASKDFPLNLKIGDIKEIKQDKSGIFLEAIISVPYSPGELNEIYLK